MPNGKDAHVKLDLTRIASGRDPNLVLEPGDILWVPHTFDTRIQEFIAQNIFLRGGITATYTVTGLEFMNRSNLQSFRGGSSLEDSFDPFGFLTRGSALSTLSSAAGGS